MGSPQTFVGICVHVYLFRKATASPKLTWSLSLKTSRIHNSVETGNLTKEITLEHEGIILITSSVVYLIFMLITSYPVSHRQFTNFK